MRLSLTGFASAVVVTIALGVSVQAQIGLIGTDSRVGFAPAGSVSFPFEFLIDPSTASGGDLLDIVVSNPSVAISVICPNGAEVNALNAASLGFDYTIVDDGNYTIAPLGFLSQPGTHVVFSFSGQPPGTYQVKADATSVASNALIIGTYSSSSSVHVGIVTQPQYTVGDTVILTGLVVDGTTPVLGANVAAQVSTPQIPNSQVTLGTYQLVSQTAIDSQTTQYEYTVTITNNGPAATAVTASIADSPRFRSPVLP